MKNIFVKLLITLIALSAIVIKFEILGLFELGLIGGGDPYDYISYIVYALLLTITIWFIVRIFRNPSMKYEKKWNWVLALIVFNAYAVLVYIWFIVNEELARTD